MSEPVPDTSPAVASPSRNRIADLVLVLIALVSVVQLIQVAFHPQSFARDLLTTVFERGEPKLLQLWHGADGLAHSAAGGSSDNIIASFSVPSAVTNLNQETAGMFYFRANYTLWPQRMFVAEPGTVINTGTQLLSASCPTDGRWLADHDVKTAVQFRVENGQLLLIQRQAVDAPP